MLSITKEEAEKITDKQDVAEKLLELFPKDIETFTKTDFLETTEPYEYLYLYIDDAFTLERKKQQLDAIARKCGVRNFPKLFKEFCTTNKGVYDLAGANVTNFPNQPITLRTGNYVCDLSGVKCDMEAVCSHPIMPVQRLVNIDTGEEKIKIAYSRGRGWRTAIFDRKTIATANSITELAKLGISVTSESAKALVRYFSKLEELNSDLIEENECVTRMGWVQYDGEMEFAPYVKNLAFDGEANYKRYYENVKSKGDIDSCVQFVRNNIRSNSVIARIVYAAALSSVLIKPLGCLPFVLHLWGETESAKTVMMMCAASAWANPEVGQYIQTFNATMVGLEKSAAFYNNLPFMLDELQIINERKDFEKEIYMLTEGTGKTRGNKTGGLDLTSTWKNCIMTTGEKPILTQSSGGGSTNRVIEVECKEKFFSNPREVANFVKSNYGAIGHLFLLCLKDNGFEEAERIFSAYYSELTSSHDTMQKQAQSAALILTADKLITDWIFKDGKALTTSEISEFLKTKAMVSINPRAYEYVCEVVAANQNRFQGSSEYGDVWGQMDNDSVYILKNRFMQICSEGGYNAQSLLSWLADRKLIRRTDTKHYDVKKRVGGAIIRCVHLTLGSDLSDDLPDYDF